MPTRIPMRLAIWVVSLGLAAAGCGTTPAGSTGPASQRASTAASPSVTASDSAVAASPSAEAAALLWPAPADSMERTAQAGLKPQPREFMSNHVHAHLDVFVDGKP